MADVADKREMGISLMFIGLAVWVADLLVVFYLPAAVKIGGHPAFISIIVILAIVGLALMVTGYGLRGGSEPA